LCVVEFVSGDADALDDIDSVKASGRDDYKENDFYVGGYPHQSIVKGAGMSQSRYSHYSLAGKIQDMKEMDGDEHAVLLHSTDCSPGQNGAPLYVTNEDGDKFIGAIHSG
jgi:V8-like Glu-specific endopeptidase